MVSLYFHIPFCTKKCPYCHFYVLPDQDRFHSLLLQGLELEWERALPLLSTHSIRTIYFGGGTPSLLKTGELATLLHLIRKTHSIENIEITMEANPEKMDASKMREFHDLGINRLSFGVQSFDAAHLTLLGRTHSATQAAEAILLAERTGFKNISLDLMYDLPGQTPASYQNSLEAALKLPITHLSLYNLTIEPHTAFFKRKEELLPHIPDEEASLEMYRLSQECTKASGFEQYEISAFAKPGFHSRHNSGYWLGTPFLGFGPSAFSYFEGKRFRNIANINRYTAALQQGESPVDFEEELSPESRLRELLAIRLRLISGVDLEQFPALPLDLKNIIDQLIEQQLLKIKENTLSLSEKGILLYDSVATELI